MPSIRQEPGTGPCSEGRVSRINPAAEVARLQQAMNDHVGPLRTRAGLERALAHITELAEECETLPAPRAGLDPEWLDLHDLRNMRLVAECIVRAALARQESRGAHQRQDWPDTSERWQKHQRVRLASEGVRLES